MLIFTIKFLWAAFSISFLFSGFGLDSTEGRHLLIYMLTSLIPVSQMIHMFLTFYFTFNQD